MRFSAYQKLQEMNITTDPPAQHRPLQLVTTPSPGKLCQTATGLVLKVSYQ